MTARHAGPVKPGETSTLDQLHACQHEISAYMVDRAAAPVQFDVQAALRDRLAANMRAIEIMQRVQALLLTIEWDVEHG